MRRKSISAVYHAVSRCMRSEQADTSKRVRVIEVALH